MTGRLATWLCALLAVPVMVLAAVGLDGSASFGRLAVSLGLPGSAVALLDDPQWRGVALYRAGRFEQAAEAFREAGPRASYNRGNALARAGNYRAAVEAYDAVLYRNPNDEAARVNRVLVAVLVTEVEGENRAGGRIAASGTASGPPGKGQQAPTSSGPAKVRDVRKPFTDQLIVASPQWLATLADEPGRYLKLRLAAEQEQRRANGLAVAPPEDPR